MSGQHSIRLFLRRGQQLDLRVEEIPQLNCRVSINADASGDYRVVVDWPLESGREPADDKCEVYDAPDDSAATKDVGIHNGNLVGVGNQTGSNLNQLLSHQPTPDQKKYLDILNAKPAGVEP